jgi:hypothetical protein
MSKHVTHMEIGDAEHFTRENPKMLISLEGAHVFCMSIFGEVEHLRGDLPKPQVPGGKRATSI